MHQQESQSKSQCKSGMPVGTHRLGILMCLGTLLILFPSVGWAQRIRGTNSETDTNLVGSITTRNIFNPNRSNRAASAPPRRRPERSSNRSEFFSLLGTMSYEKGRFAFFDGTGSQYRKTLKTDDSIGEFTISKITADYVTLVSEDQRIELRVGRRLEKQSDGKWLVSDAVTSVGSQTRESTAVSSQNEQAGVGSDLDEATRRLMQKREQEMNGSRPNPKGDTSSAHGYAEPPSDPAGDNASEEDN